MRRSSRSFCIRLVLFIALDKLVRAQAILEADFQKRVVDVLNDLVQVTFEHVAATDADETAALPSVLR